MENSPLPNVEIHTHNGIDALRVKSADLEGAYDGSGSVKLTGDQTVAGIKTFSSIPVLPVSDPTTDNQAVRKAYVDTRFAATEIHASDTLRDSADISRETNSASYVKGKEIQYNDITGTIRVKFDLGGKAGGTGNAYARIYKNNVAYGTERITPTNTKVTFSEDLTFATGDLIQIYYKQVSSNTTALLQNFQLYYDKAFTITPGTIITD